MRNIFCKNNYNSRKLFFLIVLGCQLLDLLTTYIALGLGLKEQNYFINKLADLVGIYSAVGFAKLVVCFCFWYVFYISKNYDSKVTKLMFFVFITFYFLVVISNIYNIHTML